MNDISKLDWTLGVHTSASLKNTPVLLAVFDDSVDLDKFVRQNKFSLIYFHSSATYDEIETEFGRETAYILFGENTSQEKMIFGVWEESEIIRFRKEYNIKKVTCCCTGARMEKLLDGFDNLQEVMKALETRSH